MSEDTGLSDADIIDLDDTSEPDIFDDITAEDQVAEVASQVVLLFNIELEIHPSDEKEELTVSQFMSSGGCGCHKECYKYFPVEYVQVTMSGSSTQ